MKPTPTAFSRVSSRGERISVSLRDIGLACLKSGELVVVEALCRHRAVKLLFEVGKRTNQGLSCAWPLRQPSVGLSVHYYVVKAYPVEKSFRHCWRMLRKVTSSAR